MAEWWTRLRAWWDDGALPQDGQLGWLMEAYAWLLAEVPGSATLATARLLLPTEQDFPVSGTNAEAFARSLFAQVKDHAAMGQWPVELVILDEVQRPEELLGLAAGASSFTDTNGWFSTAPGEPTRIGIRRALAADWEKMAATLAHELGHYRLSRVSAARPGGPEAEEALTDLCAVAMGFGLFSANTAVRAEGIRDFDKQGWRISGTAEGYLTERELAAALALFCELTDTPDEVVHRHLRPTPRRTWRVTRAWLREHHPDWGRRLRERHSQFRWT